MSEQKMIESAWRFRDQVTSGRKALGFKTDTAFTEAYGIPLPAFTAAVTTYTMSERSIELRAMLRQLLKIEDV